LPWRPSSFFCLKCDEVFFWATYTNFVHKIS
jgi:hypothetical protein